MNRSNIAIIVILVVLAVGVIAYAGFQSFTQSPNDPNEEQNEATSTNETASIERINAQHQYNSEAGEHIVAGTLQTPTICHVLETRTNVNESAGTTTATIAFELENNSETCAQAIGEARFKETFEAPEDAEIEATLNGEEVILNLAPVPEGEDLADFEKFIKG